MKKITSLFIMILLMSLVMFNGEKEVSANAPNNITITYTLLLDIGNQVQTPIVGQRGLTVTPTSYDQEGYEFLYYIENGVVQKDLEIDNNFKFEQDTDLIAVYRPSNQISVLFIDINGSLIEARYLSAPGAITEPTSLPTKPGYQVLNGDSKWLGGDISNITNDTILILQYEKSNTELVNINVDGSVIAHEYNDLVTISSDLENFSHWVDENDVVVSFDKDYTFTVLFERTLTAVSTETPVEPYSLLYMQDVSGIRAGYESYMTHVYLHDDDELIEHGYLLSNSKRIKTYGDENGTRKSNLINPASGEYLSSWKENTERFVRAYAVIKDVDGNYKTIFSEYARYEVHHTFAVWFNNGHDETVRIVGELPQGTDWDTNKYIGIKGYDFNERNYEYTFVYKWFGLESSHTFVYTYKWRTNTRWQADPNRTANIDSNNDNIVIWSDFGD